MSARSVSLAVVACAWACAACNAAPPQQAERAGTPARLKAASSEPLPARFEVGRAASPEDVARLDIDVMPDGTGLPPGSGTALAGEAVYAAKCTACHGPDGKGGTIRAPLVGRRPGDVFDFADSQENERAKTIGSYWPHATTLFDYVRRAMPFDRPGSLSDQEVYAVVAWLLWKNEVIEQAAVLDATSLPRVRMPARDRFVRDDRETSTRVR